jgi:galactofuranose transport system ATP-binding protein
LPEDRKAAGIVDDLSVRENIILAMQASRGWFRYLSLQNNMRLQTNTSKC